MLLSYNELLDIVAQGVIGPVELDQVNAASIDVRLNSTVFVEQNSEGPNVVSLRNRDNLNWRNVDIREEGHYDLRPGEFILASTIEIFHLPNDLSAEFKLKSSGARVGLNNVLATWCDNGWNGSVLTLELKNESRFHTIRLRHGDRIGQMIFHKTSPVPQDRSYAARGRYNGDISVQQVKP